jgi:hypothetical protein
MLSDATIAERIVDEFQGLDLLNALSQVSKNETVKQTALEVVFVSFGACTADYFAGIESSSLFFSAGSQ